MEYQNIIKLLDNRTTETSKFRTKSEVKINDDRLATYDKKSLSLRLNC